MRLLQQIAQVLLIIGGLNWGLVGLFDIDLVATLFGDMTALSRLIYTLVGISALIGASLLIDTTKKDTEATESPIQM